MKKWLIALLAGAMVFSFSMSASATSLKTYGYFMAAASNIVNYNFNSTAAHDRFTAGQRLRFFFDFIANENLKATVGLEINQIWGDPANGATKMDKNIMVVKRAMLTFKWPDTNVTFKIGAQGVALPGGAFANPVLFCDIAGALVNVPVNDMISVTAGWLRPWSQDQAGRSGRGADGGNIDAALLSVPVKLEGVKINPYFVYAFIDKNVNNAGAVLGDLASEARLRPVVGATALTGAAKAYWLGMGYDISLFQPIDVKGQVVYGKVDAKKDNNDRSGIYVDLAASYKMDMMTPMAYFVYSSGDDANGTDGSEMLPILGNDYVWATPVGFVVGNGCNFVNVGGDGLYSGNPLGFWLVGLALKDISVVDNLSSTFAIEYGKGTIDKNIVKANRAAYNEYFSKEDSFFQMKLESKYKIYENLAAILELSYGKLNMDENVWGKDYLDDAAYGAVFGFKYKF